MAKGVVVKLPKVQDNGKVDWKDAILTGDVIQVQADLQEAYIYVCGFAPTGSLPSAICNIPNGYFAHANVTCQCPHSQIEIEKHQKTQKYVQKSIAKLSEEPEGSARNELGRKLGVRPGVLDPLENSAGDSCLKLSIAYMHQFKSNIPKAVRQHLSEGLTQVPYASPPPLPSANKQSGFAAFDKILADESTVWPFSNPRLRDTARVYKKPSAWSHEMNYMWAMVLPQVLSDDR